MKKKYGWVIALTQLGWDSRVAGMSPAGMFDELGEIRTAGSNWGRFNVGQDLNNASGAVTTPVAKTNPGIVDDLHRVIGGTPWSEIPSRRRAPIRGLLSELGEAYTQKLGEDSVFGKAYGKQIIFTYPEDRPIASSIRPFEEDDED